MDVKSVKLLNRDNGGVIELELNEVEMQMLLAYAINDLLNRGSATLFSEEEAEKLEKLEEFLQMQTQGGTQ
jgi:ABC-type uncharacterized transport system ATPase subunit